ncbi:MAG: hypothetical protein DRR15_19365 [Gammaproteobacteria bacterium]|nr:MAG: hypothetical protein DRR15_19365 [Gammaproteobacteria bacterium]
MFGIIIAGHQVESGLKTRHRNSNELYLIKAAQAWPFVDTVSRLGGPVVSLCRKAGMPLKAVRKKSGVIGEHSLWRFVEIVADQLDLEHFGYLTATEHPVDSTGELGNFRLRMAPTLEDLLQFFIEDVRAESTGTYYSLKRESSQVWFDRVPIFRDSGANWQAEQYVIMFVVQIVRLFAGNAWLPSRLRISSRSHPVPVPAEWSSIDIEWGQPTTGIRIDADVLALRNPNFVKARDRLCDGNTVSLLKVEDLVDRQIWSRDVGIENAAAELGLSATTLKRRLRDHGRAYSTMVENRRLHWAKKLLAEPHIKISSIAFTLGYAHVSNFCRAFSRTEGVTPTAFRLQATADKPEDNS